jgi:DNA-binding response OmpR family regulator
MADLLLIEDDEAQRFVARFALKKAGHEVREAQDGVEGLRLAREQRPEVIVCDVMMPAVTGYDVLAQLRADPRLATVPVILLTAMSDRKHMRQGMTAGADDYLTKPYRPEELIEAVNAVLARRQVHEEAFRSSVSGLVETALEQQKETLGRHYENQLQREINKRWTQANRSTDLHYARAVLLLADLIGSEPEEGETALAERVKQVQQAARDTLYLFGATQVLPYGPKLMAVFAGDQDTITQATEVRVMRAALALAKSVPRERQVTVAVHVGPVALVAVTDGLHGDQGHALVPGEAVNAVASLEEAAAAGGWRIAVTGVLAAELADQAALGRKARTRRGEEAVEVLGLAP